jgi:L-lactate dehydrogenase
VLPPLLEVAPDAVVVVVSNPVDVITYAALKILGLPRNQVLGSGTVLDSSRLRALIAAHCGVAVQSVHAYIAGEHGDSEIPLWTSATVGAVPLLEWNDQQQLPMTAADRDDLAGQVINAGYRILHGKGHQPRRRPRDDANHRGRSLRRGPGPARDGLRRCADTVRAVIEQVGL